MSESNNDEISTAQKVQDIVKHCLYSNAEVEAAEKDDRGAPRGAVVVEGIVQDYGFHPTRLMESAEEIRAILREVVTDEFTDKEKEGWSFLNLCVDRKGEQWAEHQTMEALVCLAMGLRWAKCVMPRLFWPALPGGVPYYFFDFEKVPSLKYPIKIETEPKPLDQDGAHRFRLWERISKLAPDPASVIYQEMWERLEVPPMIAKKQMSPEARVWALTNAGLDPNTDNVKASLRRFGVDPDEIFKEA